MISSPGTNQLNALPVRPGGAGRALEQRPEQDQVEDGLEDAHDHPHRLAQGQDQRIVDR